MTDYLLMVVSAIFVHNVLLARYLGNCPFLGTSKRMDTAVGMGMAVIFVLTMAGVVTWFVEMFFLRKWGLVYLRTIVFILVIASLVQFVEIFLKKNVPALYTGLGIFLPLITTNCAVLGVAIINVQKDFNFLQALIFSMASATGFSMALVLFAGLRERMALSRIPTPLQGTAIGLITAGLMSLAFLGFLGMA